MKTFGQIGWACFNVLTTLWTSVWFGWSLARHDYWPSVIFGAFVGLNIAIDLQHEVERRANQ